MHKIEIHLIGGEILYADNVKESLLQIQKELNNPICGMLVGFGNFQVNKNQILYIKETTDNAVGN